MLMLGFARSGTGNSAARSPTSRSLAAALTYLVLQGVPGPV